MERERTWQKDHVRLLCEKTLLQELKIGLGLSLRASQLRSEALRSTLGISHTAAALLPRPAALAEVFCDDSGATRTGDGTVIVSAFRGAQSRDADATSECTQNLPARKDTGEDANSVLWETPPPSPQHSCSSVDTAALSTGEKPSVRDPGLLGAAGKGPRPLADSGFSSSQKQAAANAMGYFI
ncbi:hypothetical protein H920_07325 [Fukomys damarensis]|uniref:Uncharacterized protein n=1 Tax=Fukomys damarensis TaxID=885580 RepID=A0A091E812_FUKDA|nr:hypothetical protein H920_07325 [Fukomys damarensis]